jgi:hypothetical protein
MVKLMQTRALRATEERKGSASASFVVLGAVVRIQCC